MKNTTFLYDEIYKHDFKPDEKDAYGFIQWKGTDVCMDIKCKCGYGGHYDGDFFYHYKCPKCGRKYAIGQHVKLIELTKRQTEQGEFEFKTDD